MKVLHIIHSLSGGGAERQLLTLVDTAQNVGIEMAVFCVRPEGAYRPVKNLFTESHRKNLGLNYISALRTAIKSFNPDIIQVWLPPAVTIPAMLTAKIMGVPIIFSYRNAMHFRRGLDVIEYVIALALCARVISNTNIETCNRAYRFLYNRKNGANIPNSVSVPCKKSDYSNRSVKKLIFVGRITQAKNWITLLIALSKLSSRSDWKMTIYGAGEDEPALHHKIKELNLSEHVRHEGFSTSIYQVMADSDALVFPSLYEGMPNVLLEAFAIGLYVIASDITANRQVVGNNECLSWFAADNAEQLSTHIADFLDGRINIQDRVAMSLKIAKQYSPENNLRLHMDVYAQLVNNSPATPQEK